jgi:nicotinamide mononucleotide transporter
MSYLEFFGTLLNILCVYLVAKKNIWSWPIGIVATILFGILFYQIQLYSDFFEQIYFLVTGFWGWWLWLRMKDQTKEKNKITLNTKSLNLWLIALTIVATFALGYFMSNIHLYFPVLFPIAASFVYLDAFTTVLSFVANMLLVYKRIESWILWILVDIIGIWLYFVKDVKFVSLLYVIFLINAIYGLCLWFKDYQKNSAKGGFASGGKQLT